MKYLLLLALLIISASCTVMPTHRVDRIEYCEKVRGVIYCRDETIDRNDYEGCSVYDGKDCD